MTRWTPPNPCTSEPSVRGGIHPGSPASHHPFESDPRHGLAAQFPAGGVEGCSVGALSLECGSGPCNLVSGPTANQRPATNLAMPQGFLSRISVNTKAGADPIQTPAPAKAFSLPRYLPYPTPGADDPSAPGILLEAL